MTLWVFSIIFFGHWYSDFVMQTREMARKKSRSFKWLGFHVVAYTCYMMFFSIIATNPLASSFSIIWYVLLNGVLHFITDALTSRLTTYFYKKGDMHSFFSTIGFDQFVHVICLYGTYLMFFGV